MLIVISSILPSIGRRSIPTPYPGRTGRSSRARVPRIPFHDLRHTSATLLLDSGEHPKVVQERLGHAFIRETLDRYSHVLQDMQQRAAERFDAIFEAAQGDEATGTE